MILLGFVVLWEIEYKCVHTVAIVIAKTPKALIMQTIQDFGYVPTQPNRYTKWCGPTRPIKPHKPKIFRRYSKDIMRYIYWSKYSY